MKKVKIICSSCNAVVYVWDYRKKTAKYCSPTCRYKGISATKKAKWKKIFESGQKKCSLCKTTKPFSNFYKSKQKWDGYDTWCKKCKLLANQKYVKNPEIAERKRKYRKLYNFNTKERQRINRMKHLYGITFEEYEKMFSKQEGKCKICNKKLERNKRSHIDHCHISKRVRGLLCNNCNSGLGNFMDDVSILSQAIKYLQSRNSMR